MGYWRGQVWGPDTCSQCGGHAGDACMKITRSASAAPSLLDSSSGSSRMVRAGSQHKKQRLAQVPPQISRTCSTPSTTPIANQQPVGILPTASNLTAPEPQSLVITQDVDGMDDFFVGGNADVDMEEVPFQYVSDVIEEYWFALTNVGGLLRLDSSLCVLQDWDSKETILQIGAYHHVVCLPRGPGVLGIACTCFRYRSHATCLHREVVARKLDLIRLQPFISPSPMPPAVLLHTTPFHDQYIFSCGSTQGRYESGKRVIVSLQRDGRWHCQSCRYMSTCKHRPHAVEFAKEAGIVIDSRVRESENEHDEGEAALMLRASAHSGGVGARGSVSYLPIPPPRWCSLPMEPSYHLPRVNPMMTTTFSLDEAARCSCGTALRDVTGVVPTLSERTATVYGASDRWEVTIYVTACPTCRHARRQIGPDLGSYGIFNWNNTMLFTHELLNGFTNAFTASETPFSSYCLTIQRNYTETSWDNKFCSDDTFVRVWFAFTRLQSLDSTMSCPTCGPSPNVVIVDGISLGTHTSKLTTSVKPPTFIDSSSESITSISSWKARLLPAIPQPKLRTIFLKLLDTTMVPFICTGSEYEVYNEFCSQYPQLLHLVEYYTLQGVGFLHRRYYRSLLQQIAAPDIILQLIPYDAISLLRIVEQGSSIPEWLQSICPAIGSVLNSHQYNNSPIPSQLRDVLSWLADRAYDVYTRLAQHDAGPINDAFPQDKWQQTGTCYGLPQIRSRRIYSKLKHDTKPLERDEDEMGNCNKFFKTYPKNNLTGGIFVLWCTHSICLGFHSIPVAEGRNDVFSAIYTRFRSAPKVIIYDFACQLAPYCLVREAQFFCHTRFLIDELHAHDHSHCGQACFASNAMLFDDQIRAANTSAAECGNKGMKRIRKSVSFMNYQNAIVFTKVFLDVWNRNVINRLSSRK